MYRHHAQTLKVKEIVDSGKLGRLQMINGAFTYTLKRKGDIRLTKETGGGSIWDVGCYPISYARMIAGHEPVEVFGWQVIGDGGADMRFVGQMKFGEEVHSQFNSSFVSAPRWFMEIVGTDATLNVPMPYKPGREERIAMRRGDLVEDIMVRGGELYEGEVEDMADAVLLGKAPRISLEDSRGNVAAIVALIRSADEGKSVILEPEL
jgi:D-xylose 1-dehydrogenase (NADP+, D-xylono-1,5-lactone-forming)